MYVSNTKQFKASKLLTVFSLLRIVMFYHFLPLNENRLNQQFSAKLWKITCQLFIWSGSDIHGSKVNIHILFCEAQPASQCDTRSHMHSWCPGDSLDENLLCN